MYFQTMTEGRNDNKIYWSEKILHFLSYVSSVFWPVEEYNSSIQEKLPLIIGSAATGVVFIIAITVLIIVCRRLVCYVIGH